MPRVFREEFIEKIKDEIDIVDVIGDCLELKRAGVNYKGVCPFHNEKTPSFVVSPAKQIYHCFGCGAGGDVIKFVEEYKNISFSEAVEFLAERAGLELEVQEIARDPREDAKNRLYELNKSAAIFYRENLRKTEKALRYLQRREIDHKSIQIYGLGYAQDSWTALLDYLKSQGFTIAEMLSVGLIIHSEKRDSYYDRFRNRLMFPILDTRQRVIGFGGRAIDDSQKPKYLNSTDSEVFNKGWNLFSLNLLRKKSRERKLILAEGYMDVIALFQSGIYYAVASLGTALTKEQVQLIKKNAEDVYICYDTDQAGRKATKRAIERLAELEIRPKIIVLDGAKDPDEYIKKFGKESFLARLEKAFSPIEYYDYDLRQEYDISDSNDQIKYLENLFEVLSRQDNKTEVELYLRKIADELKINADVIRNDFYERYKNRAKNVVAKSRNSEKRDFTSNEREQLFQKPMERNTKVLIKKKTNQLPYELLYTVTISKKYYEQLQNEQDVLECFDDELKIIYETIGQAYEQSNPHESLEVIKEQLEFLAQSKKISLNQLKDIDSLHQIIIKLKKYRLNEKKNKLKQLISETSDEKQREKYMIELNDTLEVAREIDQYMKTK
jgi:DNA primase